jgi:hypothetical protein
MSRATVTAVVGMLVVGIAFVLAGCSGGGGGASSPYGKAPACPLLAQLARTGETVARADVSDPTAFNATLEAAVTKYVSTANKLRTAVPEHLRGDVERMISAVQQERFADAVSERAAIDRYARSTCKTTT